MIGLGLVALVVPALNAAIAALGAAAAAAVALLPDMPDLPDEPSFFTSDTPGSGTSSPVEWVAWFFPVHTVVQALTFVLAMWLLWQAVAVALRWAKVLS